MGKKRIIIILLAIALILAVVIGVLSNIGDDIGSLKVSFVKKAYPKDVFLSLKSYDELEKVVKDTVGKRNDMYSAQGSEKMIMDSATKGSKKEELSDGSSQRTSNSKDHSTTNVQVEGVDESDRIKNDGEYIYHISDNKVNIIKAYPAKQMKKVKTISVKEGLNPVEMYIDENYITLICNSYDNKVFYDKENGKKPSVMPMPDYQRSFVNVLIYDKTNMQNIKLKNEFKVEGYYLSSRKIKDNLYLMTNKNINYYSPMLQKEIINFRNSDSNKIKKQLSLMNKESLKVTYCLSDGKDRDLGIDNILCFRDPKLSNYLIMSSINIKEDKKPTIKAFLGGGDSVYASKESIYVAIHNYNYYILQNNKNKESTLNTEVYKFDIDNDKILYNSKAELNGRIINQFSMDEYNGYFRIATTDDNWGLNSEEQNSKNSVFILDKNMNITGKIGNIAPGEQIYSTRFLGEKLYMVTFKTVDPLFVIDLKNPKKPQILGQLKIPGFSNYIHPYDENHIIGFGHDTSEKSDGRVTTGGIKMAMFDVSDVKKPKQKFVEIIGKNGAYSELLNNHKALLFSKEKNLLAFPVTIYDDVYSLPERPVNEKVEGNTVDSLPFNGAYIYNVDKDTGFDLKGKVRNKYNNKTNKKYYYNPEVERIVYINNVIYTVSENYYKALDMNSLKVIKVVELN